MKLKQKLQEWNPIILLITALAKAVEAGMRTWALHLKSADKKRSRRCIDAAESFIRTYRDLTLGPNVKKKLLRTFEKRFWKYNQ